ncbi:DNA polymerase I [bacterium]|nr:MAG: DNA polymerase I [bacterium]QQR62268.1 MAG: DNA polymerase I [bacterium]QQR63167.1 MAG: DNA polymerase I [bacterium]
MSKKQAKAEQFVKNEFLRIIFLKPMNECAMINGNDAKNKLFLIDASAFLYRAYYGLKPLHTSKGVPVQAVYAFIRMIKKLAETLSMHQLIIVWDSKGKTERHELFAEYKATRQAPPDDLFVQKDYIKRFIELAGICAVEKEGIEADDIMYSLALDATDKWNMSAVLVTSDKDMQQALQDAIIMYDPLKEVFIDQKLFFEKHGFQSERVTLFYALVGDSSDNIPGVAGIGKVTATELVAQYENMDELYKNIEKLKPKVANALLAHKANAYLSLELFTLRYYQIMLPKSDYSFNITQLAGAMPLFVELEFHSLVKQFQATDQNLSLFGLHTQSISDPTAFEKKLEFWKTKKLITVLDEKQLVLLVEQIKAKRECAVDTETDGKHPLLSQLVGVSLATDDDCAYYIPCHHETDQQIPYEIVIKHVKPLLEDPAIKKYMHNAKFDMLVFKTHGVEIKGLELDTMIAARLVNPEWQKIGLKVLSEKYFQEAMLTFDEVVASQKYDTFAQVPMQMATLYAAADAMQTQKLVPLLLQALSDQNELEYYTTVEHPLVSILCQMECEGILIDLQVLKELGVTITELLQKTSEHIFSFANEPFNLNSPKQVEQFLFNQLHLPPQKKLSKSGSYSTDQGVLQQLEELHPVIKLMLQYRELAKIQNTYVESLPLAVNPKTGRIHTSFSQTIVATGRLSSSEPNLQNIPASGLGLEVRRAFIASPGKMLISVDYSQIELRVLAYMTQDKALLKAFDEKIDIHAMTAAGIFKTTIDQVTSEQRQIGKRINFSILYGQGAHSLSKELKISHTNAQLYIDGYFAHCASVREWMDTVIAQAQKDGYIKTFWGRKRYIANINQKNKNLYQEACRVAVNSVIQGTAADIVKKGMIALDLGIKKSKTDIKMLLQIHDELILETPLTCMVEAQSIIEESLKSPVQSWNIPFEVTFKMGHNWKEVSK